MSDNPEEGDQSSCVCGDCKQACRVKPGWFMPGEAERLAEEMGLTLQELFDEHLAVDWWEGTPHKEDAPSTDTFVLAPAIGNIEPGGMYPAEPKGQCVFYDEGLCEVHDTGEKPYECRQMFHTDTKPDVKERHRDVANAWNTDEHQAQIRDLLGREPESKAYEPMGLAGNPFLGWSR